MSDVLVRKIRVCLVDDDQSFCEAVKRTLESVGYEVETYSNADDLLKSLDVGSVAVVLVDLLLPGKTGLSLCKEIVAKCPNSTFIIVSGQADVNSTVQAMKLGAIDVLEKPFSREKLVGVVNDAVIKTHEKNEKLQYERRIRNLVALLSNREKEVLDAIAEGLVTKEIAKRLGISARTVDVHRSRILEKLEISSPLQLANILSVLHGRSEHPRLQ